MSIDKKKVIIIMISSVSLFLVGILFVYIGNQIRDIKPDSVYADIFEFSFFGFAIVSLLILLFNIKFLTNYEKLRNKEKGLSRSQIKEKEIPLNLEVIFGNVKRYNFLIPIGALLLLLTLYGFIPNLLQSQQLGTEEIVLVTVITTISMYSSVNQYKAYKKKIEYIGYYENDRKSLISEVYKLKARNDKSILNKTNSSLSIYDTLLMDLGEEIVPINDVEKTLISHLKKTYGLYRLSGLFILLIPHLFGLIFVTFDGGLDVLNEGGFWFNYIGLVILFSVIYIWFKYIQKEGRYILENYKYHKAEVIKYLEDKRLIQLGKSSKQNGQINKLKYDQILNLIQKLDKDILLFK